MQARCWACAPPAADPTSHAAILARALGLHAVCGVDRAALEIEDGTAVLLDGTAGTVLTRPNDTEVAAARCGDGAPRRAAPQCSGRRRASRLRRPTGIASRLPPTSAPPRKPSPPSPRGARLWDCCARSCCSWTGIPRPTSTSRPTSTARSRPPSAASAGSSSAHMDVGGDKPPAVSAAAARGESVFSACGVSA